MSSRPFIFSLVLMLLSACAAALGAPEYAWATDPEAHCGPLETIAGLVAGKPHFERQAMVMQDEIPGQQHRFELFMNSGEGDRHSYSLLRIRKGGNEACIVTAGLVTGKSKDGQGHGHLTLRDENNPDIFDIVTCEEGRSRYVITRAVIKGDVCAESEKPGETPVFIASFGRIVEDHRSEIPWPGDN